MPAGDKIEKPPLKGAFRCQTKIWRGFQDEVLNNSCNPRLCQSLGHCRHENFNFKRFFQIDIRDLLRGEYCDRA